MRREFAWAGLMASLSLSAVAEDYLLIFAQGSKPARQLYFADINSLQDATPIEELVTAEREAAAKTMRMYLTAIQESPSQHDGSTYEIHYRCRDTQYRIVRTNHMRRDEEVEQVNTPQAAWSPVSTLPFQRGYDFACKSDQWKRIVMSGKDGQVMSNELIALGYAFVGRLPGPPALSDLAWKGFWKDGQRPASTSGLTAAEKKKKQDQAVTQLQSTSKQYNQHAQTLTQEAAFQSYLQQRAKQSQAHPRLLRWQGENEQRLLRVWGAPSKSYQSGNTRYLGFNSYLDNRSETVNTRTGQVVAQNGGIWTCSVTFELLQGGNTPGYRVVDVRTEGNDCDAQHRDPQ